MLLIDAMYGYFKRKIAPEELFILSQPKITKN